jgi:hypothetical protein
MNLADVQNFFAAHGLPFTWLTETARGPMLAVPPAPLALAVDVAIVIPDVHLGIGPGDAFQENDGSRVTRLEAFLDVVGELGVSVASSGSRFAAVQLGDFYDVMRTSDPAAPFEERLAIVLDAYPGVHAKAQALPLLHCIGNHDHELYDHRELLPRLGINAHITRALGPGVLAFHGNDLVSLRDVDLNIGYQTWLLSLVQTFVDMPAVGPLAGILQRFFDESLADPIFDKPGATSLPWPAPAATLPRGDFPEGWTAPWTVRDQVEQLGEPMLDWERNVNQRLELAILGHSHRPGISWCEVDAGRRIPVVDVGSWTYGRSSFAVVTSEGVGVAHLV